MKIFQIKISIQTQHFLFLYINKQVCYLFDCFFTDIIQTKYYFSHKKVNYKN